MGIRQSFSNELAEKVAFEQGMKVERIIPSRRGSTIIAISDSQKKSVIKIADLNNSTTENDISPSRSIGIKTEAQALMELDGLVTPKLQKFQYEPHEQYVSSTIEYIEGQNLSTVRDINLIRRSIKKFLDAIEVLHHQKFIHGDIHPENCILTPQEEVKIVDFELAKNIKDASICPPGLYHFRSPESAFRQIHHKRCFTDQAEETFTAATSCLALLRRSDFPINYPSNCHTTDDRIRIIIDYIYTADDIEPTLRQTGEAIVEILNSPCKQRPQSIPELRQKINI